MTSRTLMVLLALVGCNDKGDDSSGTGNGTDDSTPSADDADKDGFAIGEDCNDGDAAVNPDAVEVCDGVDNDCDTTIDVGAIDATNYYADADVDGYGAGKATASCSPIAGSVANGEDCDDTRLDVNPAGQEVCDEADADEDCDTLVDDDDDSVDPKSATILYADGDVDSYGDPDAPLVSCSATAAGYVVDATDCDDASVDVNPAATEICDDGVDNNCDSDGCGWSGSVDVTEADASLVGTDYTYIGFDVVPAGDFDGDGIGDIVVGSSSVSTAYVFLGPVTNASASSAGATLTSPSGGGDSNGAENFPMGDQDGDGFDDIAVGSYNYSAGYGRVYVILGPVSGKNTSDSVADGIVTGDYSYGDLGWQLSAGDVNGDGVVDLMAPAPGAFGGAGGVYLYNGPVSGDLGTADASAAIAGLTSGDWTGGANGANGDANGDGLDDLLISAEQTDYASGAYDDGVTYLFYGPVSGSTDVSAADVVFHGSDSGSHLGWINSIDGDVDGDGSDDVGMSAALVTAGDVWVFYAKALAAGDVDTSTADGHLEGDTSGDEFGYTMDMGGDLDADGFADVAVTAPYHGGTGIAYVFHGPISGTVAATKADFTINATGPQLLGTSVSFVDDANADGFDDLAVGSTNTNAGGSYRGAVSVWFGGGL